MSIQVITPGALTTVQDLGRSGYQAFGVPVSGVMDPRAMRLANILCDNPEEEAVLECTLLGPALKFTADNVIALTGGDLGATLDGQPLAPYSAYAVKSGQTLRFTAPKTGCRAYLAFHGGLDIPLVMGSRSTYLKAKLGGFSGRKLEKGDELGFGLLGRYAVAGVAPALAHLVSWWMLWRAWVRSGGRGSAAVRVCPAMLMVMVR